jgi:predicted esterase
MTEVRTFPTPTLGRYLVAPAATKGAPLLVGFHGYGQNAEALLRELDRIPGAEHFHRVSVQALHRFYNVKTQEVVGSWMTSLDRDAAIQDNLAYVGGVLAQQRAEAGSERVFLAGFSQGAAMAWRTAAHLGPCAGLLVLGGDLPPDVAAHASPLPEVLLGRGDDDPFYSEAQLAKDLAALRAHDVTPELCRFPGGHWWDPTFLESAGRFLASRL